MAVPASIGCAIKTARTGWRATEFTHADMPAHASLCSPDDSPSEQKQQQLTSLHARIVQDAAAQRAMTSGGCGMDA